MANSIGMLGDDNLLGSSSADSISGEDGNEILTEEGLKDRGALNQRKVYLILESFFSNFTEAVFKLLCAFCVKDTNLLR